MAAALIGISIIFLLVEYLIKTKKINLEKNLDQLNWKDAFLLALPVFIGYPRVSRAGIVLVAVCYGIKGKKQLFILLFGCAHILPPRLELIKTHKNIYFKIFL
jgi:hypothetical protein